MQFLDKKGLSTFLAQLKNIFGNKTTLDQCTETRATYLLNIDYEHDLAFDVKQIIFDNSPYVGSAVVGSTCVA